MEFEKWSIRLRFEIEKMMNTFEGDKVWWRNLKWYSDMKLKFERWKCESEMWRMKNLWARRVEIDKFKNENLRIIENQRWWNMKLKRSIG